MTVEALTTTDFVYAELLLAWARSLEEHGLTFESYCERELEPEPVPLESCGKGER